MTYTGPYSATIDLRHATDPSGKSFTAGTYPDFAYNEMSVVFTTLDGSGNGTQNQPGNANGNNPAVPVVGLVAGDQDIVVGQLTAAIKGTAAFAAKPGFAAVPVPAGYFVKLIATKKHNNDDFSNDNGGTGNTNTDTGLDGNLVATTTTAADGSFVFTGIESLRQFKIVVTDTDTTNTASSAPTTKGWTKDVTKCGQVVYPSITVSAAAGLSTCLVGVSPAANSNISVNADGTSSATVTFTFNQALKPSDTNGLSTDAGIATQALTSLGNPNNIYRNVDVNFVGFKSSNVAHSLSWDATGKVLTVTIPNVAPAGIYSVDISNALAAGPANIGANADCGVSGAVTFYTFGSSKAAAPTVSLLNAPYDYADSITLSWLATNQAKAYNVYCQAVQNWGTNQEFGQWILTKSLLKDTFAQITAADVATLADQLGIQTLNGTTFVENNSIKITYDCKVRGVNADGTEGLDAADKSNEIDGIHDGIAPKIIGSSSVLSVELLSATTLHIQFNEPMNKADLQNTANYTLNAAISSAALPAIAGAVADLDNRGVTLTLAAAIDATKLVVAAQASITTGPNGVNNTPVDPADVQVIALNEGLAHTACVTSTASHAVVTVANVNDTQVIAVAATAAAGAVVIDSGANGICETAAGANEAQTLALGAVQLGASTAIRAGADLVLQSVILPGSDDTYVRVPFITLGAIHDVSGNPIDGTANIITTDGFIQ